MRKSEKDENKELPHKAIERARKEHLLKMQQLADKFSDGMRVYKHIYVNDATNSLLLVKSVKYGTIVSKAISSGGLHQLLVVWDGSRVPVPEMPDLIHEEW